MSNSKKRSLKKKGKPTINDISKVDELELFEYSELDIDLDDINFGQLSLSNEKNDNHTNASELLRELDRFHAKQKNGFLAGT